MTLDIENDTSRIQEKIKIRESALIGYSRESIIEYFAGNGMMTNFWAKHFEKIICIDSDISKMKLMPKNSEIIYGNNYKYVHLSSLIEVVDCDAYNNPYPLIKEIITANECSNKIIFFTWSRTNEKTIKEKLVFDRYKIEIFRSKFAHNSYYGYLYLI